MREWFSKVKERVTKIDKDDVFKWSCFAGAGLLSFIATVFEQRKKDRLYKESLPKEIQKQAKQILESMKKEKA